VEANSSWLVPPDWDVWANVDTCELWEAVALSLDIEPDALRPRDGRVGGVDLDSIGNGGALFGGAIHWAPPQAALHIMPDSRRRKFEGRQKVGESNLDGALKIVRPPKYESVRFTATIRLRDFVALARNVWPNDLPAGFPDSSTQLRKEHQPEAVDAADELGPKQRKTHQLVIAALVDMLGAKLDARPHAAAKDIETRLANLRLESRSINAIVPILEAVAKLPRTS